VLEICGTLKIADAVSSQLLADVAAGATTVSVADVSHFRVGQWVTVSEDNPKLDHKGGRRYGETVTITAIDGNQLTVSAPLGVLYAKAKWQITGYATVRKAFVTTSHSAILLENVEHVIIYGGLERGVIDGNRATQRATAPLATDKLTEDLRANCGIGVVRSSWVKIENLLLRDAHLHNLAFQLSPHCEAANVEACGATDKNICVLQADTLRLVNNFCHDSVLEDGICCHSPGGKNILIANNRASGHKRYGIHVGLFSPNMLVARNSATSNGIDFLVQARELRESKGVEVRIGGQGEQPPLPPQPDLLKRGVLFIENRAEDATVIR
jgi:hypothetical protein